MGTTPTYALRYPEPADPPDVPTDMHELALDTENTLIGKVPKDGVTVAGTRILASKLVSADAQPAFQINGDGGLHWGPGGSTAPDTNLYRSAAGQLKTDGSLVVGAQLVSNTGTPGASFFLGSASGDAYNRFVLANNGGMQWGPGNTAPDTQVYRYAANQLANYNNTAWGTYLAAAFSVQSDRRTKKEIEPVSGGFDKLLDAGVYTYERDDTSERHLGLLADELPDEVLTTTEHEGESLQFVDLYKLTAALLATVQDLAARLEKVEA
jgi:hypothetical protein